MPTSGAEVNSIEVSFQEIFRKALIESLTPILGKSATRTVAYKVRLFDGIVDPAKLHEDLFSMFGVSGTMLIELRILNSLQSKLEGIFNMDRHASGSTFLERNYKLAWQAFRDS